MKILKIAALFVVFIATNSFALTFEEIQNKLKLQPALDTVEAVVEMNTAMGNMSFSAKMHLISLGSEKYWMQMEMSNGQSQRTVRNGAKAMILDLKTGQKQILPIQAAAGANPLTALQNPFAGVTFKTMKTLVNGYYEIECIAEDKIFSNNTYLYNAKQNRIESIKTIDAQGATTLSTLEYCKNCAEGYPSKIEVSVTVNGVNNTVSMNILKIKKPKHVSEFLFEIR